MTTTILLIRHGQTEWNALRRWQGHADIPLNEVGLLQAQLLAQRLRHWPIQAIYSSNLQRAAVTARILGDELGLDPIIDTIWCERHVGRFEGLTMNEIKAQFPEVWEAMQTGPLNVPDGEKQDDILERAGAAFDALVAKHTDEMTAVISHGGTINAAVHHALNMPPSMLGRLSFRGNTGISIIEIQDGFPRLVCLNDTAHLEDGLFSH